MMVVVAAAFSSDNDHMKLIHHQRTVSIVGSKSHTLNYTSQNAPVSDNLHDSQTFVSPPKKAHLDWYLHFFGIGSVDA